MTRDNRTVEEASQDSDRHRTKLVLNESLERQIDARTRERDRIWELSQDMLGLADRDGVWRSINSAWTRTLGWSSVQIVGQTSEWLEHPEDRRKTRDDLGRVAAGETALAFENRFRTRNGGYRLLSWRAESDGNLLYCVARDITSERERDIALRDSKDFTRLALSAVGGVGVWTYDVATDCFFCDGAISELYGLNAEQAAAGIKRASFLANVHPDDLPALRKTMTGGLEHSGDLELEYRIRHPSGGVRWVLSRGHTYFDAAGIAQRRTGVGIEMTKQRQFEEQFRQAQKMEAVGQLTGGIAHDFNNLLAGIGGALELLEKRIKEGRFETADRYISAAKGSVRRAAALTHRLLAFARRQTLDPKPTDANRLIGGMEEFLRSTVGPAVRLDVIGAADLWLTQIDPSQLENSLLNLCINARDAMAPAGGTLTIETANQWLNPTDAPSRDLPPGAYVSLRVTDTGAGMTAEVIERAFDPFFTTKPTGQGTGLGLSMVYGFARQSGGQVRIDSELGKGTTLCLYLPRSVATEPYVETDERVAADPGEGETVLIVDDEDTLRGLMGEVLHELGYVTVAAADGSAALRLLKPGARIDLLITDVGLPGGINGRQLADAVRVHRPQLKVLFITGYAESAVVGNGQLEPGMEILTKPFPLSTLAARVRKLLSSAPFR